MTRSTPISDLMTRSVRTLGVEASIDELRRLLREEACHHVPIVEGHKVVGIVSARDLLRCARDRELAGSASWGGDDTTAGDLMSTELVAVLASEPVEAAINRIADGRVHSLLVLDEDGHLAGIVTDTDLLDFLAS